MNRTTKLVATATVGTGLVLGALGIGFVGLEAAGAQTPAATADAAGHGKLVRRLARQEGKVAADTIGISGKDLRADLRGGQSIADVANAKGVDVATVESAIVTDVTAKLDKAVTNGKLTQERATAIEQRLPARVDKLVNRHRGQGNG